MGEKEKNEIKKEQIYLCLEHFSSLCLYLLKKMNVLTKKIGLREISLLNTFNNEKS